MIDKIRWRGYPPYKQSVYDSEELTALELAGRTTYKMNEVIDKVNNLEANIGSGGGGVPGLSDNLNSRAINVKYPPRDLKPAVGDGVTDDSDAINAISTFAKENNMAVI